jgi:uncharacterized membrane protein
MQSINRAILNPAFFFIFFGSIILLSVASIYEFHTSKLTFSLVLAASICYLIGTVGVTGLGNVPLNDQLEALDLLSLKNKQMADFRAFYESKWNLLHQIRTVCAVGSFALLVLAVFTQLKKF